MNGSTSSEGRIEICYNNTFGTICDDQWGRLDAEVACRQLGFSPISMQILCVHTLIIDIVVCNIHVMYPQRPIENHSNYVHLLNSGPEAHSQAYFGEGQGDIYLVNVQCNGNESSLEDCPASELGVHNCYHSEDAGIKCQSMDIIFTQTS